MNAITAAATGQSRQQDVETARMLLQRLGVSIEDLAGVIMTDQDAPTFRQYVPKVSEAVTPGARRVYGTYWNKILEVWADRKITDITASEIGALREHVRENARVRANSRGGRSAAEHLVAALRCLYRQAESDGLITKDANPATQVAKPRRLASPRHAVADARLAEINNVIATSGDDPHLDALIVRLHTETACRRAGALALRPCDLDETQCLILLREKGGTRRWQPVSPTLMAALIDHGVSRQAPRSGQLLRYRSGKPITRRRYDYLWRRVREALPWASTQQISTHWLRHTTLTWVERAFGHAVARAYAGHAKGDDRGTDVTVVYTTATLEEVATALAVLTGEPHPLAHPDALGSTAAKTGTGSSDA